MYASRLNYTVNAELTGVLCVRGFLDNLGMKNRPSCVFVGLFAHFLFLLKLL